MNQGKHIPSSVLDDIISTMSPKLKQFHEAHEGGEFFDRSYYDICTSVFIRAISTHKNKDELTRDFKEQRKQFTRKKKRWLSSLLLDCRQIPVDDKAYPFRNTVELWNGPDKEKWRALYGNRTLG